MKGCGKCGTNKYKYKRRITAIFNRERSKKYLDM